MPLNKNQQWGVIIQAVTEPVLIARIAVLLRKYDVVINTLQRQYTTPGQEVITLQVHNQRDNMSVAMKKLERLIPIISLQYQPSEGL